MDKYSDNTLKRMTKDELIKYVRMCEHNREVAEENATQQYENFKKIVKDWKPVLHARWEICCDGYYPYCTNCKEEPKGRVMTDYCPHCGAKMDKKD